MRKLIVSMMVAISVLLVPGTAAAAPEDPACTLPVKPHWC